MEPLLAAQARLVPCIRSLAPVRGRFLRSLPRQTPQAIYTFRIHRPYSERRRNAPSVPPSEDVFQQLKALESTSTPPPAEEIERVLKNCEGLAIQLKTTITKAKQVHQPVQRRDTVSSSLSLLEEDITITEPSTARVMDNLSKELYKLVEAPQIFISDAVLRLYVDTQAKLGRPESLPKVLNLFASKPIPIQGSSPIQFKQQNPRSANAAIPPGVANKALDAAIEARILPLCLDVIDETTRKQAYLRRKLITKAWPLAAGFVLTPPFAYLLARRFNDWQVTMTENYATWGAFTGICCYVYFTGTIGYVALTTSNDQMERVTWQDGIPLWQRWAREDERAMMDRIAMSWGFKEKHRRGEEEGAEWEALKELTALRDMVLDRVELMEGME